MSDPAACPTQRAQATRCAGWPFTSCRALRYRGEPNWWTPRCLPGGWQKLHPFMPSSTILPHTTCAMFLLFFSILPSVPISSPAPPGRLCRAMPNWRVTARHCVLHAYSPPTRGGDIALPPNAGPCQIHHTVLPGGHYRSPSLPTTLPAYRWRYADDLTVTAVRPLHGAHHTTPRTNILQCDNLHGTIPSLPWHMNWGGVSCGLAGQFSTMGFCQLHGKHLLRHSFSPKHPAFYFF